MSSEWYCQAAGTVSGPFSLDELRLLVKRGRLAGDDSVRRGANGHWVPVRSVPGLLPHELPRPKPRRAAASPGRAAQPAAVVQQAASMPSAPATAAAPLPPRRLPPGLERDAARQPSATRKQAAIACGIALLFVLAVFVLLLLLRDDGAGGAGSGAAGRGFGTGGGDGLGAESGPSAGDESIVEVVEEPPGAQTGKEDGTSTEAAGGPEAPPRVELSPPPDDLPLFTLNQLPQTQVAIPQVSQRSLPQRSGSVVAASGGGGASLEERLEKAGAKTGDVQLSLIWNNRNDLDLYVECPSGERIFYRNKQSKCRGELDVDMNAGTTSDEPVENVYWPQGEAPRGDYRVFVHHYRNKGGGDPTAFQVTVRVDGRERTFRGRISHGQPMQLIHKFTRGAGD